MAKKKNKNLSGSISFSKNLKALHIQAEDGIQVSDSMKLIGIRTDRVIGYRETDSNGRQLSSDSHPGGNVSSYFKAAVSSGEGNVHKVCHILAERMSTRHTAWTVSMEHPDSIDIDCYLDSGDLRLNIQVTRADQNPEVYQRLNSKENVERMILDEELGAMLKNAIDAKAKKIAQSQRSDIVLVLDATDTPDLSLDATLAQFHSLFHKHLVSLGFREVWLVGPTSRLTHRLA